MNLHLLTSLKPSKVYVPQDLEDPIILECALQLVYAAHFGQQHTAIRISPYIQYNYLQVNQAKMIEAKMAKDEATVKQNHAAVKIEASIEPMTTVYLMLPFKLV